MCGFLFKHVELAFVLDAFSKIWNKKKGLEKTEHMQLPLEVPSAKLNQTHHSCSCSVVVGAPLVLQQHDRVARVGISFAFLKQP